MVRKSNGLTKKEREKPDGNFEFGSVYVCLREGSLLFSLSRSLA